MNSILSLALFAALCCSVIAVVPTDYGRQRGAITSYCQDQSYPNCRRLNCITGETYYNQFRTCICQCGAGGVVGAGVLSSGVLNTGLVGSGLVDAGLVGAGVPLGGVVGTGVPLGGVVGAGALGGGVLSTGLVGNGVVGSGVLRSGVLGSGLVGQSGGVLNSRLTRPVGRY